MFQSWLFHSCSFWHQETKANMVPGLYCWNYAFPKCSIILTCKIGTACGAKWKVRGSPRSVHFTQEWKELEGLTRWRRLSWLKVVKHPLRTTNITTLSVTHPPTHKHTQSHSDQHDVSDIVHVRACVFDTFLVFLSLSPYLCLSLSLYLCLSLSLSPSAVITLVKQRCVAENQFS